MPKSQSPFSQLVRKCLVVLIAVASALPLAAQSGLGAVHGTVTDQSRAIIRAQKSPS